MYDGYHQTETDCKVKWKYIVDLQMIHEQTNLDYEYFRIVSTSSNNFQVYLLAKQMQKMWTQRQKITRTADGNVGNTVVTHRDYLQHARFGVVLGAEEPLLTRVANALQNPVYGLWLGRKACIPASPVFQGVYESATEALDHLIHRAGTEPARVIEEVDSLEEDTELLMDEPVNFRNRTFNQRRIRERSYPPDPE